MSLYRTWRPKSFSDLVGQDAVVRTLRTALTSGKLAHAYLFSGPRGSGKTSAAKILARCIDCVHGPTPDPDNDCESCRAMLSGTALDVIEIDAASNRGIEEIRALRESVKFAPASMRSKVFIIDEAHMLTREGANAFLKTLEEPPPYVVFILATTAPESLPATILSRCQRYAFRRIPVGVMIERMREISAAEDIAIADEGLGAIAYRADGGLRDALTMLEQVAAYAGPGVTIGAEAVDAAFGSTGHHYARALVAAALASDAARALRVIDEASDAGADLAGLIRGTIGEFRNLLVARIDPELLDRDLAAGDAAAAVAAASSTPQTVVTRALRLLADALAAARASGDPRLQRETAVLRLVLAREDASLDALAARVAALEGGTPMPAPVRAVSPFPATATSKRTTSTAAAPVAPSAVATPPVAVPSVAPPPVAPPPVESPVKAAVAPEPAPVPVTPVEKPAPKPASEPPLAETGERTVTLNQVRSLWSQVLLRAEEKSKPIRALLSRATVDALEGNALTVGASDPVQESLIRDKIAILEAAVAAATGVPLRVIVKSRAPSSPSAARSAPRVDNYASAPRSEASPPAPRAALPEANAHTQNGDAEIDLLAYARERIGNPDAR